MGVHFEKKKRISPHGAHPNVDMLQVSAGFRPFFGGESSTYIQISRRNMFPPCRETARPVNGGSQRKSRFQKHKFKELESEYVE